MLPNISNAILIPGWTNEAELLWLAEQALTRHSIVEVGCWKGRSTRALADNTPGFVIAVDTWKGTPADGHYKELADKPGTWLYNQFYNNCGYLSNVNMRQCESIAQARLLAALGRSAFDMIFIDAAHDYESVKADIVAWRPRLVPGGLLCGHDFDAGRPGVVQAVRELIPNIGRGPGSIWIAQ